LLDARICEKTNGKKSLDDVFKKLYRDFYGAENFGPIGTGFTDDEFLKVCNEVGEYDFSGDFNNWLDEANTPDYQTIIGFKGDISVNNKSTDQSDFGVITKITNGKTIVDFVHREGTGESIGINVNDEIISINGYRVENNLVTLYEQLGKPENVNILISRGGELKELAGKYKTLPKQKWSLDLSFETQKDSFWKENGALQYWLRSDD
jgi:predicted metalloprotease with PDZ domain